MENNRWDVGIWNPNDDIDGRVGNDFRLLLWYPTCVCYPRRSYSSLNLSPEKISGLHNY